MLAGGAAGAVTGPGGGEPYDGASGASGWVPKRDNRNAPVPIDERASEMSTPSSPKNSAVILADSITERPAAAAKNTPTKRAPIASGPPSSECSVIGRRM